MPTGYTEIIETGCTFEEYLWRCVRAFGVALDQRDESLSVPVRDREPRESYYVTALAEEKALLAGLRKMNNRQAGEACAAEYRKQLASWENSERERKVRLARYIEMRARVADWEPPIPEHAGLKSFMLAQIDLCLPGEMARPEYEPKPIESKAWHADRIANAKRRIADFEERVAEEKRRLRDDNRWLAELRKVTPQPKAGAT